MEKKEVELTLQYLQIFRDKFNKILEKNSMPLNELGIRDYHKIIDLAYRSKGKQDFLDSVSVSYTSFSLDLTDEEYSELKKQAAFYIDYCNLIYRQD